MTSYRFAAFISYSHAADARTGPVLESLLESFPNLWYRSRRRRIYVDHGDLASSADLWGSIETALDDSRLLIVLASPEAAASRAVQHEVGWWLEHRSVDDLIIVLTGGEIAFDPVTGMVNRETTTSLPAALLDELRHEPNWVRLPPLPESGSVDAAQPNWQSALADIAARLDGVDKDDLVGEHVRNRSRALRLRTGLIGTLSVLLVLALVAAGIAYVQRNIAREQALLATSRQLVAEANAIADVQPDLARQLLAEAYRMQPTDEVIGALINSASLPYVVKSSGLLTDVAVSLNRGLLAVSGRQELQLCDAASGATYDFGLGGFNTVAMSADADQLAASSDHGVLLYDISGLAHARQVGFLPGSAQTLSYLPAHVLLVATATDTRLWDITDPAHGGLLSSFPSGVTAPVALSPDGHTVAVYGPTGGLELWDISDPRLPHRTGVIGVDPTALAFDGTGHLLATGSHEENVVRLWDISNPGAPQLRSILSSSSLSVDAMAISSKGQTLAIGSGDGSIRLWDLSDPLRPAPGAVLSGLTDDVNSLAFAAGDSLLVSGSAHASDNPAVPDSGTVRLWPISGAQRSAAIAQLPTGIQGVPAFSPRGSLLAGGFPSTIWRIGYLSGTQQLGTLSTFNQGGQAVAFSPDGHRIVSGYPLVRWDVQDPGAPKTLDPSLLRTAMVPWIAYAPDGRTVALPGPNGLELWSANGSANHPLSTLPGSSLGTNSSTASLAAYSPDGANLATVEKDGQAVVWDITHPDAPVRQSLVGDRNDPVTAVAFGPRAQMLTVGRSSGSLQFWDISNRAQPQLVSSRRPVGGAQELAMQPGGQLLASSGVGGGVVLWSLRDPTQPLNVATFAIGDNFSAPTIAFSPDGGMLAASHEGQTVVWDTNIPEILSEICARTAPIDQPTWATYLSGYNFDPPCAQPEQRK